MKFDAVIFDCDGVLVDSEALAIQGQRRALSEIGLNYSPAVFVERFTGLHDDAFFAALRADYEAAHKCAAPDDLADKVLAARRKEMARLTIIDGADKALAYARGATGKIAIASSSRTEFLNAKLDRMNLLKLALPHVYSTDLVENGKPAGDIFRYAAAKMNVAPARCLVIEDSVIGVLAGVDAGMMVWGFTGGGHCHDGHGERLARAGAAAIAPDFDALIARL